MNKAQVIKAVSERTGIALNICEMVIKAFEEQAGSALAGEFLGNDPRHAELLARISKTTGIRPEDCEKIVTALQAAVKSGLSEKLGFLKRLFGRS